MSKASLERAKKLTKKSYVDNFYELLSEEFK